MCISDSSGLLDDITSDPEHSQIPPIVIAALLRRIFSIPNPLCACDSDMYIHDTLAYLELLEQHRAKRVKVLERREGSIAAEFIKTSHNVHTNVTFVVTDLKY